MASGLDRLVPSQRKGSDPEDARVHLAIFGPSTLERVVGEAAKDALVVLFSLKVKAFWLYLNEMDPDHYSEEWIGRLFEEFLEMKYPQLVRKIEEIARRTEVLDVSVGQSDD